MATVNIFSVNMGTVAFWRDELELVLGGTRTLELTEMAGGKDIRDQEVHFFPVEVFAQPVMSLGYASMASINMILEDDGYPHTRVNVR
ncbi:hypothetical protein DSO57_1026982 [Entomophthora muscae]|uniref:Uncharacterized protein n=1 Tax=Entomophthora muscae TaxID=34485 RepID=A0ACC2RGS5_9FUNG|nr:hypothetical protein DSO57_1026982 [Entomophthora muscae]